MKRNASASPTPSMPRTRQLLGDRRRRGLGRLRADHVPAAARRTATLDNPEGDGRRPGDRRELEDPPGTAPPGDVGIAAAGAGTGLSTTYVFTGNGGYSADGLGQNVTGGTIQAEVPTGSTVKKAFLYGTYFGGQIPPTRSARSTSTEPGS